MKTKIGRIESDFALLDVKVGRGALNRMIDDKHDLREPVPVVIYGLITHRHGAFHGISQEFGVEVVKVEVVDGIGAGKGRARSAGRADPVPQGNPAQPAARGGSDRRRSGKASSAMARAVPERAGAAKKTSAKVKLKEPVRRAGARRKRV
jgi:hypothetical protein